MTASGTYHAMCPAGRTKVSGLDRSPTMRASEKFSVARDDRNMPSSRSEKDVMSWYCCAVGLYVLVKTADKTYGSAVLKARKMAKTVV